MAIEERLAMRIAFVERKYLNSEPGSKREFSDSTNYMSIINNLRTSKCHDLHGQYLRAVGIDPSLHERATSYPKTPSPLINDLHLPFSPPCPQNGRGLFQTWPKSEVNL